MEDHGVARRHGICNFAKEIGPLTYPILKYVRVRTIYISVL